MTVTPLPGTGLCPSCGEYRVELLPHRCPTRLPDGDVRSTIIRAGAHAADPDTLPAAARLAGGVNDLDVARLLRALECGTTVTLVRYRWHAPTGSPLNSQSLAATVSECLRLGLVHATIQPTGPHTVCQILVAAPVHLRSPEHRDRPRCPHPAFTYRRYRLMNVEDVRYVDCSACLALA